MFQRWFFSNIEMILCFLLLIARIGDLLSTWLMTPSLELETNPIVRRLGWKFALPTILVCFLPFASPSASVMVLVPCLLVCASNFGKLWTIRTLGEKDFHEMILDLARRGNRPLAYLGMAVSSSFVIAVGLLLGVFYPDPASDWGFWVAAGIVLYGGIVWLYGSLYFHRIFILAER